ncbi:unannotated protein [freshwater metagenome]|uniref:Unannotated protein n=1 Tax=freshwater metagenome TaxID=449393 RepID=A0A6J6T1T4_9ZZZZ
MSRRIGGLNRSESLVKQRRGLWVIAQGARERPNCVGRRCRLDLAGVAEDRDEQVCLVAEHHAGDGRAECRIGGAHLLRAPGEALVGHDGAGAGDERTIAQALEVRPLIADPVGEDFVLLDLRKVRGREHPARAGRRCRRQGLVRIGLGGHVGRRAGRVEEHLVDELPGHALANAEHANRALVDVEVPVEEAGDRGLLDHLIGGEAGILHVSRGPAREHHRLPAHRGSERRDRLGHDVGRVQAGEDRETLARLGVNDPGLLGHRLPLISCDKRRSSAATRRRARGQDRPVRSDSLPLLRANCQEFRTVSGQAMK